MRVYFNEHDSIFMLAFDGAVTIGAEPGPRVDNILLNGTVAIIERQPIFKERFLLDRVELEPGIVLKFKSVNKQIAGKLETVVLLRVDPSDGNEATAIQVTANSAADAVEIIRYGAADYSISPSPWARIKTDPLAQMLLTVVAILASLAALADYAQRFLPRRRGAGRLGNRGQE